MDYQHLHDLRWCCIPRSFEKVQTLFLDSIIAQSQGSPEARPQVWGLSLFLFNVLVLNLRGKRLVLAYNSMVVKSIMAGKIVHRSWQVSLHPYSGSRVSRSETWL